MPDIALRLNKDMLVLSAPLHAQLERQGFAARDVEFVTLLESDSVRDALRLELLLVGFFLFCRHRKTSPAMVFHARFSLTVYTTNRAASLNILRICRRGARRPARTFCIFAMVMLK